MKSIWYRIKSWSGSLICKHSICGGRVRSQGALCVYPSICLSLCVALVILELIDLVGLELMMFLSWPAGDWHDRCALPHPVLCSIFLQDKAFHFGGKLLKTQEFL